MIKKIFKLQFLVIVLLLMLTTGCGDIDSSNSDQIPVATQEIFAMDTYMSITGYGEKCEEAVTAAVEEIQRIEELFSVGNSESEVSLLNQEGELVVSEDTEVVLKQALKLYDSTNGAFDISIYPLMSLWGFTTDVFAVPVLDEIENVLYKVDSSKIRLDEKNHKVTLGEGQGIDFGGIAKGYTSDQVMSIFEEYGLISGIVSLGGNVQCYNGKVDGSPWKCGIQDPDSADDILCVVSVKDKAVITSGGYERYFIDDETGKKWHHILNPKTGYSAESGLVSVSIISEQGMLADGLSTSLFVMGLDDSIDYWKEHKDQFDMILVTDDREIYVSEGIVDEVVCELPITIVRY